MNLADERRKCQHVRKPPVAVTVNRPLDDESFPGLLYGWADAPDGRTGGLRGLVTYDRPVGPGYVQNVVAWVKAADVSQA